MDAIQYLTTMAKGSAAFLMCICMVLQDNLAPTALQSLTRVAKGAIAHLMLSLAFRAHCGNERMPCLNKVANRSVPCLICSDVPQDDLATNNLWDLVTMPKSFATCLMLYAREQCSDECHLHPSSAAYLQCT